MTIKKHFKVSVLVMTFIILVSTAVYSKNLVPGGKTIGINLNTKGLLILDTAEFDDINGKVASPAKEAGIISGDIILKIDGREVATTDDLNQISKSDDDGKMTLTIKRFGEEKDVNIEAKKSVDGRFRLGVWIKDNESGIGTLTFIDKNSGEFGALGHGVTDSSNENILNIDFGSIHNARITSIKKGESGVPGEIIGIFNEDNIKLGDIEKNSDKGIFGIADKDKFNLDEEKETAERSEVSSGAASILSDVEGGGIEEYAAEIVTINPDEDNLRGMIIKITDSRLLDKTGGIVQGMSGSPILQNGKIVGAITHVLVNDPTQGYGIFIDDMME